MGGYGGNVSGVRGHAVMINSIWYLCTWQCRREIHACPGGDFVSQTFQVSLQKEVL